MSKPNPTPSHSQNGTASTIPLTILGGSDRKASTLPPSGESQRPLTGCKGVDLEVDGKPLATLIAERLRTAGFGPIYVAGPAKAYQDMEGIDEIFDTDGLFGGNIRVGIEEMQERHNNNQLAMATCDIVPDPREIEEALQHYRQQAPVDLWFPLIRVPEEAKALGSSAWKPRYRIPPEADEPQGPGAAVLPGHLAIFDPDAMRVGFLYRLLDIGYSSRNRSVMDRRSYFVRHLLSGILYRDLMNVVSLRLPTLTWDTFVHGTKAALKLSRSKLPRSGIEAGLRSIFTRRGHRRNHPNRRIHTPILTAMSLAKDIDTLEEATSLGVQQAKNTSDE